MTDTDQAKPARHDIWQIADRLQMDLRAAQARLVELRAMLAALDLPDQTRLPCPGCGLGFRGPLTLAEHIYTSHDGPLPDHLAAQDAEVARAEVARRLQLVVDGGYRLDPAELEHQLAQHGATGDELVGLLETAADLRNAATA